MFCDALKYFSSIQTSSEEKRLLRKIHASSGLCSIHAHPRFFFNPDKINYQFMLDSKVFENVAVSSRNLSKPKTVVEMKPLSEREYSPNK